MPNESMGIDIGDSGYNPSQVEAGMGATTLPNGLYLVTLKGAKKVETSNKKGHYLELSWSVVEGPHAGALVIDRLNLWNQNDLAVKIARSRFKQYAIAIDNPNVTNVSDFQGKHLGIRVIAKQSRIEDKDTKERKTVIQNEIKDAVALSAYRAAAESGQVGGVGATMPTVGSTTPASGGGAPPAAGANDDDIPF